MISPYPTYKGVGFRRVRAFGLVCWCVMVVFALSASVAQGQGMQFDAGLSLTGGTTVSGTDTVPDPGPTHPPQSFRRVSGVAVDEDGYLYVSNYGNLDGTGWVDIFRPDGTFVQEFAVPNPRGIKVDSAGNLYVAESTTGPSGGKDVNLRLLEPDSYPPSSSTVYGDGGLVYNANNLDSLAVDPANDHVLVRSSNDRFIQEFDSAANGSGHLRDIDLSGVYPIPGEGAPGTGLAVNGVTRELYASDYLGHPHPTDPSNRGRIHVIDLADGSLKRTIDGSTVPGGRIPANFGTLNFAVDEFSGDVFAYARNPNNSVYRLRPDGEYLETISHSFDWPQGWVTNVAVSGAAPTEGNLYVVSGWEGIGHVYAFTPPPPVGPPIVSGLGVSGITATEGLFEVEVDPHGAETSYRFELVDDATYGADVAGAGAGHGFDSAVSVPSPAAGVGSGQGGEGVAQPVADLEAGTVYHLRAVAVNEHGVTESSELVFSTYPGSGVGLPGGRRYELVTPPNTNGLPPKGTFGTGLNPFFSRLVSADGNSVAFATVGGALPGTGAGGFGGDAYRAVRGADGWTTVAAGMTGAQSQSPYPGGIAVDADLSFWNTNPGGGDEGSLAIGGLPSHYVRGPGGEFELVGRGSLGSDRDATGRWISPDGEHVIFLSDERLEPAAPDPAGRQLEAQTLYDRTADGTTHVVSVLADGSPVVATVGIAGFSRDGDAVAFYADGDLYLRLDNAETVAVADAVDADGLAGVAADGSVVLYVKGGDLYRFDVGGQATTQVTSSGDVTVVYVSEDGSRAFFVSPSKLDGASGAAGADNLYVSDGGGVRFVAVLDPVDVDGVDSDGNHALGRWATYLPLGGSARVPFRATADGSVAVFESLGDLTGAGVGGSRQVYRYDVEAGELVCVSCPVTLQPPTGDAALQHLGNALGPPTLEHTDISNLSADGRSVVFQSPEALVAVDVDGKRDVYQWRDGHVGLISSPNSARHEFVYAVTPDASDILFVSGERLVAADADETPSIYDARVGGGFDVDLAVPCSGDACQGQATPAPPEPPAASVAFDWSGVGAGARRAGRIRVRSVRARGRMVWLRVRAPSAGRIRVRGRGVRAGGRSVSRAGAYRVRVPLARGAKRRLRRTGRVRLRLTVVFAPRRGVRARARVRVTVRGGRGGARAVRRGQRRAGASAGGGGVR